MSPLETLGAHVSGSLEQARSEGGAAARVRARLAHSEAASARGPRGRVARLRVRPGFVVGALAVAAALLLVTFASWRRTHEALTFVVASPGALGERGVVGAFLAAPPNGELPLSFSDGTSVRIESGARARVAEVTPHGARVLLESGVMHAHVVHRSDTSWQVDAGPFAVKVTGTRFDVSWEPGDEAIVVTLLEGSVVVTGCGLASDPHGQRVSAGQQLRASCKSGSSTLATLPSAATAAPLPAAPDPTFVASVSSLPDAPRAPAETPSRSSGPRAPEGAPRASAAELLARATSERYAGHVDAAVESLSAVRQRFPRSDDAATAAFELGRIAFDARRDFIAAGEWFDTYLRERPAGTLAREALGRALEARHRGGDAARAEALASRYLSAYPDGPHAALARRLAATPGASE